jgi:uncharacterized membrane protein (DUF2068 family)
MMHSVPSPAPQPTTHGPLRHRYLHRATALSEPQRPPIDVFAAEYVALIITALGLWLPLVGSIFFALFFGAMGLSEASIMFLLAIAALALVTAIGEIAFSVGAWRLRPWAWTVGVMSQALYLLTYLLSYFLLITQLGPIVNGTEIFYAVIAGLILLYLLTTRVRRLFGYEGLPLWVIVARAITVLAMLCGIGVAAYLILINWSGGY